MTSQEAQEAWLPEERQRSKARRKSEKRSVASPLPMSSSPPPSSSAETPPTSAVPPDSPAPVATDASVSKASSSAGKIELRLQAAGDAPILKQRNYKVDGDRKVEWILAFLRKYLRIDESDHLFVYVNQSFSPSPDQNVRNLCECFGSDGKLVLYYAKSQMWG